MLRRLAIKTLDIADFKDAEANIPDIKKFGNPDLFKLICKASSEIEGWMKSTKAMPVPGCGCVVQVTTQQRNPDNSYAVAEAKRLNRKFIGFDANPEYVKIAEKKLAKTYHQHKLFVNHEGKE